MFEIKSMTAAKGFSKEQQKYIADEFLKEINQNMNINEISKVIKNNFKNDIKEFLKSRNLYYIHNLYLEGVKDDILTINVIDSNFKVEILNTFPVLMEYLKKLHVLVYAEIEEVEEITEEEEKEINLKFIKAEAEEKEKEKKDFVSVIDKLKSDYIESKEQRNNFDELLKENLTIKNIKKSFEYEKQTEKAHKKYIEKTKTHINYVTGHEYSGNNLKILNDFMIENNYKESAWLGAYQAKKINMQLKKDAKPVQISVIIEKEENKTIFKKIENIYNIADFEPIKKIEESEDFKNIVNELRKAV